MENQTLWGFFSLTRKDNAFKPPVVSDRNYPPSEALWLVAEFCNYICTFSTANKFELFASYANNNKKSLLTGAISFIAWNKSGFCLEGCFSLCQSETYQYVTQEGGVESNRYLLLSALPFHKLWKSACVWSAALRILMKNGERDTFFCCHGGQNKDFSPRSFFFTLVGILVISFYGADSGCYLPCLLPMLLKVGRDWYFILTFLSIELYFSRTTGSSTCPPWQRDEFILYTITDKNIFNTAHTSP